VATKDAIGKGGKYGDLKKRLLFLLGALIVYRIGTHIPIPGINFAELQRFFQGNAGGLLDMFNMFSGGALSRMSIFTIGIVPYISASIIVQLFSTVSPHLEALKKEGASGQRKISQYTRYGTLGLALIQGTFVAIGLESQGGLVIDPGLMFRFTTVITLVTGTMFLMWLGEQITERGLGNGISLIIFAGIAAGLPQQMVNTFQLVHTRAMNPFFLLVIIAGIIAVTWFVCYVERGQRKILINYAKRQVGNKLYGGQASHLPFKLNMAGVIPPIFASSIILLPVSVVNLMGSGEGATWLRDVAAALSPGQPIYILVFAAAIIFFCFFYTALQYNPKDTAENLKKSGAFVPGIRPGEQTAKYVERVITRLTFWGAIYVTAVCLVPEFLNLFTTVPFYFGGTSLLIVVVVTMDFMAQVQAYVMSHQYESLLKKGGFRGGPGSPLR
jgi:preprotein translocase subunit SecY